MAVAITRKPTVGVIGLTPPKREGRDSYVFNTSWYFSPQETDENNPARAEGFNIVFDIYLYSRKKKDYRRVNKKITPVRQKSETYDPRLTEYGINIAGFYDDRGLPFTRSTYYPLEVENEWTITQIVAFVCPRNSKGEGPYNKEGAVTKIQAPAEPTLSDLVQDKDTGRVSTTVTVNRDNDGWRECYDASYTFEVYDSRTKTVIDTKNGTTQDSATPYYDVADRMQLTYDQYIKVTSTAYGRGIGGDSKKVEKELYVSWPPLPTIPDNGLDIVGTSSTDKVTVNFNNNQTKEHPVTGVRLEKLVNVDYEDKDQIAGDADWQDISIQDNGECSALSVTVADVLPDAGKKTWLRVKTWNQHEELFYRYSEPIRLTQLERSEPTAADDSIRIVDAMPDADGKTAIITLGWNFAQTEDDATGTELTWSANANAWRSNSEPTKYEFTWSDGQMVKGNVTYRDSAKVYVSGLTEGDTYYFRARRYMEHDDRSIDYSSYYPDTGTVTVKPVTSPSVVQLTAPPFVARGSSIPLTWTYDTESTQTSWEVITGTVTNDGKATRIDEDAGVKVVASGYDTIGTYEIDGDRVAGLTAGAGFIFLAARISTGGAAVTSDAVEVAIADAPTASVSVSDVTAKPATITITSNTQAAASIVVTAIGVSGFVPDGDMRQVTGDTVWSTYGMPEWQQTQGGYTASVTIPSEAPLYDMASYEVAVILTDTSTNLRSGQVTDRFSVNWAHKAPAPSPSITIEHTGMGLGPQIVRACTIRLPSPEGAAETDVYDVYRATPDGYQLVASGVPQGYDVYDEYAPFGGTGMTYRIAVRTADGALSWNDYPYSSYTDRSVFDRIIRLDFGNNYVELDRGVTFSDTYTKDFETRKHLDGSEEGYWNEGVSRKGSSSGMYVTVYDEGTMHLMRQLAAYSGPVMVRTSQGIAYEANADVNKIDLGSGTAGETVSITLTAIKANAYMATIREVE